MPRRKISDEQLAVILVDRDHPKRISSRASQWRRLAPKKLAGRWSFASADGELFARYDGPGDDAG